MGNEFLYTVLGAKTGDSLSNAVLIPTRGPGHKIRVQRSIWRKHTTLPKTEESVAPVHVPGVLAEMLAELPHSSEYILATPTGRPIDLHNLAARGSCRNSLAAFVA